MEIVAGHRVGRALASDRKREHLFFTGMAVAMALVVLTGFGRSFFFAFMWREHDPDASTEPVYYVHGTLAAAWMAFAIFQPLLIRRRQVQWHRKLGWVGVALAGAVMLTGVYVAVLSGARGPGSLLPPTPPDFLGVIASGIVMFGVFVCLAVVYRRNGQAHKRLMYLATVNLIQADDLPCDVCVYSATIRLGLGGARPNSLLDFVGWSGDRTVTTDPSLAISNQCLADGRGMGDPTG
jgi:hypothetical protein